MVLHYLKIGNLETHEKVRKGERIEEDLETTMFIVYNIILGFPETQRQVKKIK